MTEFTKEQLTRIIESADDVLQALAGTHEEIHPDSKKMIEAWDYLNDRAAPPEVVRDMARQLLAGMEQEPVADVVAWSSPTEERTCDIRWRRHDVEPGPLYAAPSSEPVVPNKMTIETLPEKIKQLPIVTALVWMEGWNASCAAGPRGKAENAEPPTTIQPLRAADLLPKNDELTTTMLQGAELVNQPYKLPDDTRRLDWLDAQNKRLNEYYGTTYGWKFDANFQRNAMMLNDSNYPVMTVRQAIDEAIAAAPQQEDPQTKK